MLDNAAARDSIIVALDCGRDEAFRLAEALNGRVGWLKVGMTLFYREGPEIVRGLKELGFKIFLDLKLHDIPFQIEGAAYSAALAGADLISVHALGAAEMIAAARRGVEQAAAELGRKRAKLVAISILTSMDAAALKSIGIPIPLADEVEALAKLAREAGADGMVCSPNEASRLRELLGEDALIVCPGIRPVASAAGDQKRIATPASAIVAGASKLVIGRPITGADEPGQAAENIVSELLSA